MLSRRNIGFEVQARIDLDGDFQQAAGADVAIEFSVPDAVAGNIEKLAALRVPIVTGTTGWAKEMDRVAAAIAKYDSLLVWSPNFSVGVNVFSRLVREAARLLADQPRVRRRGRGRFIITPRRTRRRGR